jgi:DNA-binding transcriptional MerR regulator
MAVPERAYLSIGEVLSALQEEFPDVTISKIRFLESQGLIDPERTPSGYRKFYDGDIERLRFILRAQKENFLPLKVIKDRLANGDIDDPTPSNGIEAATSTTAAPDAPAVTEPAASPSPSGPPAERLPIWMQKAATKDRAAGIESDPTDVSFTFAELAGASGLTADELTEVQGFGLLAGRTVGNAVYYDEDALVVARLAAEFLRHGIEARHLRMYKVAAEREADLFEQVVLPLVKQRNPRARTEAVERLRRLSELGTSLREAMMRRALHNYNDIR